MKALFVGLSTLDLVYGTRSFPVEDLKHDAEVMTVSSGGSAANAAVACSACLGGRTALLTRMGKDPFSSLIAEDLAKRSVEIVAEPLSGMPTVSSIVVNLETGSRTIVSNQGKHDVKQLDFIFKPELLEDVGVVLTDCYEHEIALPVLREARKRKIPVVADIGRYRGEESDRFLKLVDIAIVSETFADDFQTAAFMLEKLGCHTFAMTHGGFPVEFFRFGESGKVGTVKTSVTDTLGAGDFFHGAFVAWMLQNGIGDAESFKQALGYAARVAASSVNSFGPRGWLDSFRDVIG